MPHQENIWLRKDNPLSFQVPCPTAITTEYRWTWQVKNRATPPQFIKETKQQCAVQLRCHHWESYRYVARAQEELSLPCQAWPPARVTSTLDSHDDACDADTALTKPHIRWLYSPRGVPVSSHAKVVGTRWLFGHINIYLGGKQLSPRVELKRGPCSAGQTSPQLKNRPRGPGHRNDDEVFFYLRACFGIVSKMHRDVRNKQGQGFRCSDLIADSLPFRNPRLVFNLAKFFIRPFPKVHYTSPSVLKTYSESPGPKKITDTVIWPIRTQQ